jgi:hypothetical protein
MSIHVLQARAVKCITELIQMICILQFEVYFSTANVFQDQINEDDETDVKPFLSFSVDEGDISQDMEECSTKETK